MDKEFINCWNEIEIGSNYFAIWDFENHTDLRIKSVILEELEAKRDKSRDMVDYAINFAK